jgi:hypothetical protein
MTTFTSMDIQAITSRVIADAGDSMDPSVRLRMTILRELLRYMDMVDFDWRRRLVEQLNEHDVDPNELSRVEFDPIHFTMSIGALTTELRKYLEYGDT